MRRWKPAGLPMHSIRKKPTIAYWSEKPGYVVVVNCATGEQREMPYHEADDESKQDIRDQMVAQMRARAREAGW